MQTIGEFAIQIGLFYVFILLGALIAKVSKRSTALSKLITQLIINILLPLLIIEALLSTEIIAISELPAVIALTIMIQFIGFFILYIRLRGSNMESEKQGAMLLCVTFNNGIFLPLPIVLMFIGSVGVVILVFWSVVQMVLFATFGAFLGSKYSSKDADYRQAMKESLLFPPLIVAIPSLMLLLIGFSLPSEIVSLLSFNGPTVTYLALLVVGLEVGNRFSISSIRSSIETISVRQLIVPIIVFIILSFFSLADITRNVLFIEAMMPPAVLNVVLASNFDLNAAYAASIVTLGTLIFLPIVPFIPLLLQ